MKDDKLYLIHISESIDRIESYTTGLDFQAFEKQAMVQDAPYSAISRCLPNQPSVFLKTSSLATLKLNGIRLPDYAISWFMTTWVSILRRFGLLWNTTCPN